MEKFSVIIAGSRDFTDYEVLEKICDKLLVNKISDTNIEVEIVSGGARGADALGERYAKNRNFGLKIFPADWDKFGKSAGYRRNAEMADYADALIAFTFGTKGTEHMINLAKEKNLATKVHRLNR